jgi:hypothetical protein
VVEGRITLASVVNHSKNLKMMQRCRDRCLELLDLDEHYGIKKLADVDEEAENTTKSLVIPFFGKFQSKSTKVRNLFYLNLNFFLDHFPST